MKKSKAVKRKLVATFIFAVISTIGLIIHGVFFDLDFSQIERLTLWGFLFTFVLVFFALIILEKIFDLENHVEFVSLEKRVSAIENNRR